MLSVVSVAGVGAGCVHTLSGRWLYRFHCDDPDIRWCWPRYSTSAAKAASGLACAAVVARCRRWGRGSLLKKPCSARATASVPREWLIAARSRAAGKGASSCQHGRETGKIMRRAWERSIAATTEANKGQVEASNEEP